VLDPQWSYSDPGQYGWLIHDWLHLYTEVQRSCLVNMSSSMSLAASSGLLGLSCTLSSTCGSKRRTKALTTT
jgi:hypothetical protein